MSLVWWRLDFPRGLDPLAVVRLMRTLAMRPRRGLIRWSDPVVFELHLGTNGPTWWIATTPALSDWLEAQLASTVATVAAAPTEERPPLPDGRAVELRVRSPRRPLRIDLPADSANAMLAISGELENGERIVLQWLVGTWLPRHVPKPSTAAEGGLLADLADLVVEEQLDFRDARALERKQTEAVFGCVGRIAADAERANRQDLLLQRAVGALQLVREPGAGFSRRLLPSSWVRTGMREFRMPFVDWSCPLNASELASLVMWPIEGVAAGDVGFLRQRLLAPAPSVFVPRDRTTGSQLRIIGEATHPASKGYVQLDARSALQHLHVIGPTGGGKSTLLARLALQDVSAGRSVVVIEPKGDLVSDLLDRIPADGHHRVVLLDPTDETHAVGINVLAGSNPDLAVDRVVNVLHHLYAAFWGPRTADILHAGLLSLARAGGYTLVDLPVLLTNPIFRRRVRGTTPADPALAQFWSWYDGLGDRERDTVIGPAMNKLRAFTLRSSVRDLLGQADPRFGWDQLFDTPTVLLVNLAKGRLGPGSASLLGALVISQLWNAVLERSRIAPDRRRPAMVYIDEFQDYTRLPTDLGDALAQARGLGVGFTLAHQHLAQLTPDLRAAVLNNARSRVVFQTGDDAAALAKALGSPLSADDLRDVDAHHAYASLVGAGSVTNPASIRTLALPDPLGTAEQHRAISRTEYGADRASVRDELERRWGSVGNTDGPIGGRRKSS